MPTTAVPATAVRLDAPLKARITAAQAELAREMPGLTPTFSDTVRVLINEALAARAAASPTAAPVGARDARDARAAAVTAAVRIYNAAVAAHDAAGLADDDPTRAAALRNFLVAHGDAASNYPGADGGAVAPLSASAAGRIAAASRAGRVAHNAAARVPASRGAGGITLHRATNGASVATVVANDPK
jgi:hypothetical protein